MREEAKRNPEGHAAKALEYFNKPKRCSYCHNAGHNRASCQKAKEDFTTDVKKNAVFRQGILARMKSAGLGIGALMENYSKGTMVLIEDINWDNINYWGSHYVFKADNYTYSLYPNKFLEEDTKYKDYTLNLCQGISPSLVEQQVPNGWLRGECPKLRHKYYKK